MPFPPDQPLVAVLSYLLWLEGPRSVAGKYKTGVSLRVWVQWADHINSAGILLDNVPG